MSDTDPITRSINRVVTHHAWKVVFVFLLVTAILAGGLGAIEQEAGGGQYTAGLEEEQALEDMEAEFEAGIRTGGGASAVVIVTDERNVLSKSAVERMLRMQHRLETHDRLRITSTTSPGTAIAAELDPEATTAEERLRAVEQATQTQVTTAVRDAGADALGPVSEDFNRGSARASAVQVGISYDLPPAADDDDAAALQQRTIGVVDSVDGYEEGDNAIVFGDELTQTQVLEVLGDTAIIVFPAAILLISFFLLVAYRDPIDLAGGILTLGMTFVWIFGLMGYLGIPFSDALTPLFPLLLAVGIDFGIHIINRYREERARGVPIEEAMGITTDQLTVAFLIVAATTIFSLGANLLSPFAALREFGIIASIGLAFTFLLFAVFLPAAKVATDQLRERTGLPTFGTTPLGMEGSLIGRVLPIGVRIARLAPAVMLLTAVAFGGAAAVYGTGVDTEFSQDAFFPEEERVERFQEVFPEPIAPGEYTFIEVQRIFEDEFDQGVVGSVTVFIEDDELRSDEAFTELDRVHRNPPDTFARTDRRADANSVLTVMEERAGVDPEIAALVDRYDRTGDGVPDRNAEAVYDALFDADEDTAVYLAEDLSAARIEYQLTADADASSATADAREIADRLRFDATATGDLVVDQAVIELLTDSAISSLAIAFVLTAITLVVSYRLLEGRAVYGLLNLLPVLVAVAALAGSMRLFGIPLTPINAPIFAVAIGLGVDYSVHLMHRYVDEFDNGSDPVEALTIAIQGTGGALTGSMFTTVTGIGVLYLALIPVVAEYGLLIALGVLYAYLSAVIVLPPTILVWKRIEDELTGRVNEVAPVG